MDSQRFKSISVFSKEYGVPEQMIRKEVRRGIVPGFFSGTWFHVDSPAYLEILSARNNLTSTTD